MGSYVYDYLCLYCVLIFFLHHLLVDIVLRSQIEWFLSLLAVV
jgi:hypothetical protein